MKLSIENDESTSVTACGPLEFCSMVAQTAFYCLGCSDWKKTPPVKQEIPQPKVEPVTSGSQVKEEKKGRPSHNWSSHRDKTLIRHFKANGLSLLSLIGELSMFTETEIRDRAKFLGLVDEYGNMAKEP